MRSMGYRSNVKIKMGLKAYELLEKTCLESENEYINKMITGESTKITKKDDYVLIGWTYVKWYTGYDDVKAVIRVLKELSEIVENDESEGDERDKLIKDYFFKLIDIGEDNRTEEYTNDEDEIYTSDFYSVVEFFL